MPVKQILFSLHFAHAWFFPHCMHHICSSDVVKQACLISSSLYLESKRYSCFPSFSKQGQADGREYLLINTAVVCLFVFWFFEDTWKCTPQHIAFCLL